MSSKNSGKGSYFVKLFLSGVKKALIGIINKGSMGEVKSMLRFLRIRNFKPIRNIELGLKKLNVLIGPNNSRKSSILQSLGLVKQLYSHESSHSRIYPADLTGEYVKFRDFRDLAFRRDPNENPVRIEFQFALTSEEVKKVGEACRGTPFEHFRYETVGRSIEFSNNHTEISLELSGEFVVSVRDSEKEGKVVNTAPWLEPYRSYYNVAIPKIIGWEKVAHPQKGIEEMIAERFLNTIFYLTSPRGLTEITDRIPERSPVDVGPRGEFTRKLLIYARDNRGEEYKKAMHRLAMFGVKNAGSILEEGYTTSFWGEDKDLDVRVDLTHLGFGINQLLPVITQCSLAPMSSTILIEQPEVHLHPASQARLVDLFRETIREGKQLIIETHSEHLLMAIQRQVAEGNLTPKDVGIFYVKKKAKEGTIARELSLKEDGSIEEGSAGIF